MTRKSVESLEHRVLLASQAYDWQNVAIKGNGFVDGIVYSPAQPNLVYAHSDMGGAYRWDQSQSRWIPLNEFSKWNDWPLQNLGVETLAVDPTDANRVYMGAGTYMSPTAILRSTDAGVTWQRTDVSFNSNGNGSARNTGERMIVDPNSPNILYYGTRDDGLWKTSNFGASWSQVNSFPTIGLDSGFGADTGIVFVLIDKTSSTAGNASQTIYAGVFEATAGATRIYRSIDGGSSWSTLPGGQPTTANYFPQRAALTPDGSALYLTYAFSTSYPGPYGLTEGFVQKVTNPASASPNWADVSPPASYAFSAVTLDPTNASIVYVGEMGDYNPADRIWRSTNGGVSWTALSPNSNRNDSSAAYASSLNVHWLGDLEIDPFNRDIAMFTTGYGIYRTTNLTSSNPAWAFFNDGFEQSAVLQLASPNSGSVQLFSAIGDRDGYRHDNFDQSPAIGRLGQSNGMAKGTSDDIDVAWSDPNILVRTTRVSPWVQYSNDNGITWQNFSSTNSSGSSSAAAGIAISADGTKAVYEPGGTGRARFATRSGGSWSTWTTPSSNQPANNAKIVADLAEPQTFYAYAGTTVSRSTDGGANWTVMTSGAPSVGNWIRAVPGAAGNLWMSRNGSGLWRSTNSGATWTQVAAGVVTTANAVGVGAAAPGQSDAAIYVAGTVSGETGFFRTDDQGATWVTISDAAHQYGYITVIQGDPRVFGRLYVGANGRGVLRGDIHTGLTTLPNGWNSQDIGSVGSAGSAGESNGAFEVIGGGGGIGSGGADAFRFAYTTLSGDGSITARVVSNPLASPSNNNAKAGVMIRNDLSAGSAEAFLAMTPGSVNGAVFQSRGIAGGAISTTNFTGVWNPYWVRLTRSGNSFTAERSSDRVSWIQVGTTQTIAMNATASIGLAVTASDNTQLDIATFDNVSIATSNAVSIAGTNLADAILLVRNGATTEVWLNGVLQRTFDPGTAISVAINALNGDDTVTLDFTAGNPLPTSVTTTITGGIGNDTIAIIGSSLPDTAVFDPSLITINGASLTPDSIELQSFDGAGASDQLTVNAGATVTLASTTQRFFSSLVIAGNLIATPNASSGIAIVTQSLSISGAGTLDLQNNDLIIDYTVSSPLASIQSSINSARNGGAWNGAGLSSSFARNASPKNTTLGAIESIDFKSIYGGAAMFDGETIDTTAVLVKYTYYGDTDFNGTVNFDDYSRTDSGFNNSRSGWLNGDFDGNGIVNFDDYSLIDLAFNTQGVALRRDPPQRFRLSRGR